MDAKVSTAPRNTFSARLRVGDKLIGIGFIEGMPPRPGRPHSTRSLGPMRSAAKGRRNPRAALIIPAAHYDFRPNPSTGTTESTPKRVVPNEPLWPGRRGLSPIQVDLMALDDGLFNEFTQVKLAITCRILISIASAVNASGSSALQEPESTSCQLHCFELQAKY